MLRRPLAQTAEAILPPVAEQVEPHLATMHRKILVDAGLTVVTRQAVEMGALARWGAAWAATARCDLLPRQPLSSSAVPAEFRGRDSNRKAMQINRTSCPMNQPATTEPRVLFAEFTARPGATEAVAELLSRYAETVRREPGNLTFECHQYADDPAKFFVFEAYVDEQAFQAHLGASYGAEFNRQLAPLIVEPNSILTFLRPLGLPDRSTE